MATQSENVDIAVLKTQQNEILRRINGIDTKLDNAYVTQTEFAVYKKMFWTLASAFIATVLYYLFGTK